MNTGQVIQSVVDLTVRCIDPQRIMLFGSVAQGRGRIDSDIDLLVVGRFREPKPLRGMELKGLLLDSLAMPVDLHFRTLEEINVERQQPFSLVDTIIQFGVLLYEREG